MRRDENLSLLSCVANRVDENSDSRWMQRRFRFLYPDKRRWRAIPLQHGDKHA